MTHEETFNVVENLNNNNNIAGKTVEVFGTLDLMIKKSFFDMGIEPDTISTEAWESPWIWVRHLPDSIDSPQDPNPNVFNYICSCIQSWKHTFSWE